MLTADNFLTACFHFQSYLTGKCRLPNLLMFCINLLQKFLKTDAIFKISLGLLCASYDSCTKHISVFSQFDSRLSLHKMCGNEVRKLGTVKVGEFCINYP